MRLSAMDGTGSDCVYPFTPHPAITKGIIEAADIPLFSGGGGLTRAFCLYEFICRSTMPNGRLNGPHQLKQLNGG